MKTRAIFLTVIAVFTLAIVSCTENIDESTRYVFKERTIIDFLKQHEEFSEYYSLLTQTAPNEMTQTTLKQLLSARGHYTVFAPTNEAMQVYLDSLKNKGLIDEASWDGFRDDHVRDSIRMLVILNSVIDLGDDRLPLMTTDFPIEQDAEIVYPTMFDRKLTVHYGDNSDIYINDCLVDPDMQNMEMLNGVIHCMRSVIAPSQITLGDYISTVLREKREGFYVACLLAEACGLKDTLNVYEDFVYGTLMKERKLPYEGRYSMPEHRYFGYTYFAETDAFWSQAIGKPALDITVEDVVNYLEDNNVYPEAKHDVDYASEDNILNQFVTYHLLPVRLNTDRLVLHCNEYGYNPNLQTQGAVVYDYFTTMGKRRLLKTYESKVTNGVYLNRVANLDTRPNGNYEEISCDLGKEGIAIGKPNRSGDNNIRNAMIYPIEELLVYSNEVKKNLGSERIRFDVSNLFPEIINGDLEYRACDFHTDNNYRYLDNLWMARGSIFSHEGCAGRGGSNQVVYQGNQMPGKGNLDITMKMPPVPRPGVYEVRSFQHCYTNRSIYQFYWGTDRENLHSVGLPIDFRVGGLTMFVRGEQRESHMGWEDDTEDADYNAHIDKNLRAKDYMKGPKYISCGAGSLSNHRNTASFTRRILVREYMEPDKTYYIRFKSCIDDSERYILLDYFEFCPKEVYDNPNTPEDIW